MNERGTGVSPVNSRQEHAQDGRATIKKRHCAYLPHWTRDAAWYAVTFRLWDSLPQRVIESWLFERKNIVKTAEQMKRPLSKHEEDILVRCLALFHVIVPVLLVWMVYKLRYDRRALAAQTLFCRFVLLVCVWFTDRL